MTPETAAAVAVAVSIALAAIAALWKIASQTTELFKYITQQIEIQRAERTLALDQLETRMSQRLRAIEQILWNWRRNRRSGDDGEEHE